MDAPAEYLPGFVADQMGVFDALWAELDWERRPDAPRREYWTNVLGRDYSYGHGAGRRTYSSRPTHPAVEAVADALEARMGWRYEGMFANGYENERDGLGWHADDDPAIDHTRPIAVVTVGAGRDIQFKPIAGGEAEKLFLDPGSLLLMRAGMQGTHLHRIPKASFRAAPRVSLTFRGLV